MSLKSYLKIKLFLQTSTSEWGIQSIARSQSAKFRNFTVHNFCKWCDTDKYICLWFWLRTTPQANHLIRFSFYWNIIPRPKGQPPKATFQVTFHVQLYIFSHKNKNLMLFLYRTFLKIQLLHFLFAYLWHMAKKKKKFLIVR